MSTPAVPFLARTKVSWTGEQQGDLGFLENEVVRVFHLVDDLWWQGSLVRNGAEGIFPKDFVEPVPLSAPTSAQPTPTKPKWSQTTPTKPKWQTTPTKAKLPQHQLPYQHKLPVLKLAPALHDTPLDEEPRMRLLLYSQHVLSLGLSKARTLDSLLEQKRLSQVCSPDLSPVRMEPPARRGDDFYLSLTQKKQELEVQLHHLRQLERSHMLKHELGDSLMVSEDLLLSKRNFVSRDDLGAKLDHDDHDDLAPPPPPPKHKSIPFDADDFRGSAALRDERQQYHEELKASLKSLQSDVLNLSELSATSAGSFMRHKYERDLHGYQKDLADSVGKLKVDDEDVMSTLFKDKKSRHPKIFKMLMKKKPENLMEQRLQQEDDDWQKVKGDLNRMNTLSLLDRQERTRRAARGEPNFIVKPLEYMSDINTSETFGPDDSAANDVDMNVNVRKVAEFLEKYHHASDFNDLISDISVKFGTWRPNEIRAVLMHLCKFRIIEEPDRILQTKPRLHEVMARGEATIFQLNYLFKKLLEALRIPSEVVLGFWKKPNEFYHSDQLLVNHCWLSVMVETDARGNGCFRMIDLLCFKNGALCNLQGFNEFYFLAPPTDIVSTHIPSVIELQHVCPPVDMNVAFHLPRTYSSFAKNGLEFINFNNALTRINDLEFFEADLVVPPSVELFTLIKTLRITSYDYTLCQIYWKGSTRVAKIKAILPEKELIGVLQIFAGPKGLQTHFDNIHELACVVPLYHSGQNRPCKFVPRYPTIQSLNNDLYIKHPQLSTISVKNAYNFEVEAHPSMGLNSGSGIMNQDFKLVVESPSGKYTKLVKDEPHKPFGTYRANIFCQEQGLYRGLVIGDSGNSWYVFAQWECGGPNAS